MGWGLKVKNVIIVSGEQPHLLVTRKVTQNIRPSFSHKRVLTWSDAGVVLGMRLHSAVVWVWDWDLVWVWDWIYMLQWFGYETEITCCSGLGIRLRLHSAVVWVWDWDYMLQWFGYETEITFCSGLGLRLRLHSAVVWVWDWDYTYLNVRLEARLLGLMCSLSRIIRHKSQVYNIVLFETQSSVYVPYTTWK